MISLHLYAKDDVKIVSSSKSAMVIEYKPTLTDSSLVTVDNQKYLKLQVYQGVILSDTAKGIPALSKRILNIGVPSETGNTYEILKAEYVEVSGQLSPTTKMVKDGKFANSVYTIGDQYHLSRFSNDVVSFGEYGIMRELKIQKFIFSPIQFDYSSKKIRIYTNITVRITFSSNQANNSAIQSADLLSGAVINYDVAKSWGVRASNKLAKANTTTSSVLSTGTWYRFDATDEGIYKISKSMLASMGIDASSVDPRTIKIYNNGGKVLSETVSADRPVDLVENAILVEGEDDGKFDDNDYILFYGRGTNFWDYDAASSTITRSYSPYSDHNYYWITSGGTKGKRIQNKVGLNQSTKYVQATTKAFAYRKDELINIGQTGRYFMGDKFSSTSKSKTYTTSLNGIIPNSQIDYKTSFICYDNYAIILELDENSNNFSSSYIYGDVSDYSFGRENIVTASYTGTLPNDRSSLKFTYNASGTTSVGYLNYFEIAYQKYLTAYSDNIIFFSKDTTSVIEYQLSNFSTSSISVFDVSDNANVKILTSPVLLSGGEYNFQCSESAGSVIKYIAAGPAAYKTPSNIESVKNSNIRGFADGSKFIIITNSAFLEEANKIKSFKENTANNKISTTVYTTEQIFNEFSGGSVDVSAIRDFIKYAYENWNIKPEYVLLLGDGDYDYKNIYKNNKNFVIPYETEDSYNSLSSYCSDDFYAKIVGDDYFVDIAIGRVTIGSVSDAESYIAKLISYENNSTKGTWKNLITLVADDNYQSRTLNVDSSFTLESEYIYNNYIPKSYNIKKIYLATYPDITVADGRRAPEVNQAIINAINEGTLIFNYIGHGNPEVLAYKYVFEKTVTIPQLKNDKYFFLTAATCDFGCYDNPTDPSSVEEMLLKSDGGCIGALAAVRPVIENNNLTLNEYFFQNLLYSSKDENNLSISVGKAYMLTKIDVPNDNNSNRFHLFGDPTIRLQIPQNSAMFDTINGVHEGVSGAVDVQAKALGTLNVQGTVLKADYTVWTDFNGEGVLTVYDSDRNTYLSNISYSVEMPGGLLFNGKVSVTNGKFKTSFVVPKDISYENNYGKMLFYFYNSTQDGLVSFSKLKFSGSDTTTVNDGKGPTIDIYFDDASIKNAYLVNSNSSLIVKLKDSTGINSAGTGIGHKLEGILNKDVNNPIDFTNYFTGDADAGGKSGQITYKFNDLSSGDYNLKVKAWDVFNNYSEAETDFKIVSGTDLEIRDVYNYPNPFQSSTTFTFQQNFATPLNVKIKIYTISGRLIKEIERNNIDEKFVKVDWNGRDQDGNQIANGTYLYKIIVKTVDGVYNKNVTGKLAIIR